MCLRGVLLHDPRNIEFESLATQEEPQTDEEQGTGSSAPDEEDSGSDYEEASKREQRQRTKRPKKRTKKNVGSKKSKKHADLPAVPSYSALSIMPAVAGSGSPTASKLGAATARQPSKRSRAENASIATTNGSLVMSEEVEKYSEFGQRVAFHESQHNVVGLVAPHMVLLQMLQSPSVPSLIINYGMHTHAVMAQVCTET